jgi:NitT/TauT family transport system substrate-binding protein
MKQFIQFIRKSLVLAMSAVILLISACSPKQVETNSINFAVLPIIDSLPMYVAQQEGLFEKYKLSVELVPVGSGPERDQLLASKQVDGVINEVLTTIMNNRENSNIQIVRFARAATSDTALFSILASKKSGITTVEGLKGQAIGISEGTVIEYLTDRMLQKEGFSADEIVTVAVPKIPDRLALLSSGELTAGTMPEPVTSLLASQGATVVLADNKYPEISHSAIAFRSEFINQNPETVRKFLAAIEEAVQKINADPAKYESTLLDNNILPPPLKGKFNVPQFVTAGVPSVEQYQDVLSWAHDKGMLSEDVPYDRCITAEFLPK